MNIPYRIAQISTRQFAFFADKLVLGLDAVNVNSVFNFRISDDFTQFFCTAKFQYEQENNLLLVLDLVCTFGIAPEGGEFLKNEHRIPVDFLRYMATIVVGTARGIIYAKTEGTTLNAIILPPINLVEVIKEDLVLTADGNKG